VSPAVLRQTITIAAALTAGVIVLRQCRKPFGWPGSLIVRNMNQRHGSVTDWGLSHVAIGPTFTILDVGCGGGRTVQKLAGLASAGRVCGLDYSATSVSVARTVNAALLATGRVDIQQGTVSALPYADATFDLVTAIETHYYWPDPIKDLREIRRVLKPGGRLVIVAETYRGQWGGALLAPFMKLLRARYLTLPEHRDLLVEAGYTDVTITSEPRKGWMCAVGVTPSRRSEQSFLKTKR
jgi:SAM-dependent methyltransferase